MKNKNKLSSIYLSAYSFDNFAKCITFFILPFIYNIYIAFIDTFSYQKRYICHISTHYVYLKLHLQKYDIQVLIILYIIYSLTFKVPVAII